MTLGVKVILTGIVFFVVGLIVIAVSTEASEKYERTLEIAGNVISICGVAMFFAGILLKIWM